MDIEKTLIYILDSLKRIKKYASLICDSADDDVKEIIITLCDQEIKATEYDLYGYQLEQQYSKEDNEDNEDNQRKQ